MTITFGLWMLPASITIAALVALMRMNGGPTGYGINASGVAFLLLAPAAITAWAAWGLSWLV